MTDPFLAEIRIFSGNFAPKGWAFCDGQLMSIAQNTALFSLLGVNYGGDAKTTFALPNLQGCAPMFWGQGPGLSQRFLGETAGEQVVTLLETEIPAHSHTLGAFVGRGTNVSTPSNSVSVLSRAAGNNAYAPTLTASPLDPGSVTPSGGSQPHNNMMPFIGLTFIIALQGVYPPRS